MNIFILTFHKHDKAFASDLYLIYNRSPAARVCKSDTDRLLMLYLVRKNPIIHEENTKEITTVSVVLYVIKIMLIYINFSFDFLGLRRISSPRTKLLAARCECMHLIKINCLAL